MNTKKDLDAWSDSGEKILSEFSKFTKFNLVGFLKLSRFSFQSDFQRENNLEVEWWKKNKPL